MIIAQTILASLIAAFIGFFVAVKFSHVDETIDSINDTLSTLADDEDLKE